MKKFLANKGLKFYLLTAIALLSLIALICYVVSGGKDSHGINIGVVVFLIITVALSIFTSLVDFKGLGSILCTISASIAFAFFFYARFMYFSHIAYGISSETLSGGILMTLICLVLSIILCIVTSFLGDVEKET